MAYPTHRERRALMNDSQPLKRLWLTLLAYEGASTVWGVVSTVLIMVNPDRLGVDLPDNIPTGLVTGSLVVGLLFTLVIQGVVIASIIRLDRWVRWLLWFVAAGSLFAIMSGNLAASGYLTNLLGIGAAVAYHWLVRRVGQSGAPPPGTPS